MAMVAPHFIPNATILGIARNDVGHGRTHLQCLYLDGAGDVQLAMADNEATKSSAIVAGIIDVDNFFIGVSGTVKAPAHGFTLGDTLYLSDTVAGGVTNIAPTTRGHFIQPIFKVISPDILLILTDVSTKIELVALDETFEEIEQVAHGFNLYQNVFIPLGGTDWMLAQADNPITLKQGIVTRIWDADNFVVTYFGIVDDIGHPFAAARDWYLSQTIAGENEDIRPVLGLIQNTIESLGVNKFKVIDQSVLEAV